MTQRFQKKLGRESLSHPAVEGMIRCISYDFMTLLHHGTSSDMISQIFLYLMPYLNRTWVSAGSLLLLSEDDGRYWERFASVMSDSFIRPRRFSTCAKSEAPTMENKQD